VNRIEDGTAWTLEETDPKGIVKTSKVNFVELDALDPGDTSGAYFALRELRGKTKSGEFRIKLREVSSIAFQ